jgi:hypothetical protein
VSWRPGAPLRWLDRHPSILERTSSDRGQSRRPQHSALACARARAARRPEADEWKRRVESVYRL